MINDGVTIEGLRDHVKSQVEIAYTMRRKALKEEGDSNEQWVEGRLDALMQILDVLDPQAADILREEDRRSRGPLADEPN
ncbi:Uncharacterised protein [Rhodococcus gordoniae]|uniref:Uncharacterized protein n=1 Tax=Rhodococcus gordoniae TaxID=223392 RepID=A0A379M4Q4_9NOCA|nr:hypothetical protein [Rhodococcus gordoniae]SUE16613.1 Uncharacterised protein [Rhodococcus gordoniae]